MNGTRTGIGIVFGAALGLVFGQMLLEDWWIGPAVGVAAGLIIGAAIELMSSDGFRRRPPSSGRT